MNQIEFTKEIKIQRDFLMNLALRKTRFHKQDAEDLVQTTLLNAWKGRKRFECGTNMRGWLTTIMSRHWINELRSRRMRLVDIEKTEQEIISIVETPEDLLLQKEQENLIVRVLEEMCETKSVVLKMKLQEVSYKKIASHLGITVMAVKMRMHNGRKEARKRFKELL